MKFEINKIKFQNILNTVQRAIAGKVSIPILSGIKIDVINNSLITTGSDESISIKSEITSEDLDSGLVIHEEGSVVLPAKILNEIVRNLQNDTILITLKENNQVEIKSGQAIFYVNCFDATEYPELPKIDSNKSFTLPFRLLNQVISETIFAASKQETRPILTGVNFTIENDSLKTVATDSHRLSQRILKIDSIDENINMVVPAKSLTEINHCFSDKDGLIKISLTSNLVLFQSEKVSLYSRLLEGMYPNTDRLIPTEFNTEITFDVKELKAAIERASLFSHEGNNNIVRLEISNDLVMLYGNSPEVGQVEEQLTVDQIQGDDLKITFNPNYLKAALGAIKSKQVKIKFISPIRPFTLEPVEEDIDFIQLITPVRTN